ncbi:MAG: septum formation protein [Oleiphilaceae bacterium]|jgi:septum formation protein
MKTTIILASASPRRKELLEQVGVSFNIHSADIDERPLHSEQPSKYVYRMAKSKAYEAWKQMSASSDFLIEERLLVLASDTSVVLGDEIFGKPESKLEFIRMMKCLSGQKHEVITNVHALEIVASGIKSEKALSVNTKVSFKPLTLKEIEWYWRTGEPADKAGGYGIQGRGALFVECIEGSYSAVVGLPLKETAELLADYHVDIWSL